MRTLNSKNVKQQFSWGLLSPKTEIGRTEKREWKYVCDLCGASELVTETVSMGVYSGCINSYGDYPKKMSVKKWGLKPSSFVACDSHSEKELHDYVSKKLEEK